MQQIDELIAFWFGALDDDGWSINDNLPLWFGARPQDDDEMRHRFAPLIDAACAGTLAEWETHSDASNMALLLLTDQMTRAVYRGSGQAFAGDTVALAVCKNGIADGRHQRLPAGWRRFYYLPLEHSEDIADQSECVRLFRQMQQEYPQHEVGVEYAEEHRDIIKRFGRFPHRNVLLGRTSTAEEERYLAESNQHFGQKTTT